MNRSYTSPSVSDRFVSFDKEMRDDGMWMICQTCVCQSSFHKTLILISCFLVGGEKSTWNFIIGKSIHVFDSRMMMFPHVFSQNSRLRILGRTATELLASLD